MTGATVLKWSMFYPVSISSLKQECPLPQISVAKEESLNGRYVRWCCLGTAYGPREAQVSHTVQLFRALSPACSPEVANSCVTHSLSFSQCPITFMWEKRVLWALLDFICKALMQPRVIQSAESVYIWSSLNITQFLETARLPWYYWTIMESLQLFPAFWLYGSLAVIACWFPAKQLSGEKHFQSTKTWLWNHTVKHSVRVVLQAGFFSSLGHLQLKWVLGGVPLTEVPFAVRFDVLQHGSCNIHCKRASPSLWEAHW